MKVYISVDFEGITGSTSWSSTNLGDIEHGPIAAQMKAETMAAARGAIAAGADEVFIKDAHDSGRNFDITGFPRQCRFIRDWMYSPDSMVGGLTPEFGALLYVGYHSPAGSDGSPLSHTMNRRNNYVKLNGQLCSEFLMHALYAAELGVPSVFLSGDKALCEHVHSFDPNIRTVAVKEGVGCATISITPEEACERIEAGARDAVLHRGECHLDVPDSITMEICFKDHFRARSGGFYPGARQTGPYTVEFTGKTMREVMTARMFIL